MNTIAPLKMEMQQIYDNDSNQIISNEKQINSHQQQKIK